MVIQKNLKNPKNALTELYYNFSLEVLSDQYEQSSTYDVLSDLLAEVSSRLQEAIRSNKLKRVEDENKNEEIYNYTIIQKELYNFKPKKSDFEKPEQEIIQSFLDQEDFVLKKTDDDYFDSRPENTQQIQQEFDQDNKDFAQIALEIIKLI